MNIAAIVKEAICNYCGCSTIIINDGRVLAQGVQLVGGDVELGGAVNDNEVDSIKCGRGAVFHKRRVWI